MKGVRQRALQDLLREHRQMTVRGLAAHLEVSEATIRRDLQELSGASGLERMHGGVSFNDDTEPPVIARRRQNADAKMALARRATEEIYDGATIFIGSGSTMACLAECLLDRHELTVITNAHNVAAELAAAPGVNIVMTGGALRKGEMSLIGHIAERTLRQMPFEMAFMSVQGISADGGLSNAFAPEAGTDRRRRGVGAATGRGGRGVQARARGAHRHRAGHRGRPVDHRRRARRRGVRTPRRPGPDHRAPRTTGGHMTTPIPHAGPGAATAAEIASQPQLWPKAVATGTAAGSLQQRLGAGTTVYTGCGSTGHLAQVLAYAHRRLLPTFAWSAVASELWLAAPGDALGAEVVVAVSRSGETTETIQACRRARDDGARIVAVTTNPGGGLNAVADDVIVVEFAGRGVGGADPLLHQHAPGCAGGPAQRGR